MQFEFTKQLYYICSMTLVYITKLSRTVPLSIKIHYLI